MKLAGARTDAVIISCATSAGIHGALSPGHFDEGLAAGFGFAGATVLLAALAVALTLRPSRLAVGATAVALAGLIAAYLLATTTGLPLFHPEREAVDGLALLTKAVEAVGLMLAASLLPRPSLALALRQPKGTTT